MALWFDFILISSNCRSPMHWTELVQRMWTCTLCITDMSLRSVAHHLPTYPGDLRCSDHRGKRGNSVLYKKNWSLLYQRKLFCGFPSPHSTVCSPSAYCSHPLVVQVQSFGVSVFLPLFSFSLQTSDVEANPTGCLELSVVMNSFLLSSPQTIVLRSSGPH